MIERIFSQVSPEQWPWLVLGFGALLTGVAVVSVLSMMFRRNRLAPEDMQQLETSSRRLEEAMRRLEEVSRSELGKSREAQHATHVEILRSLQTGVRELGEGVAQSLQRNTEQLGKRVEGLTEQTDKRLREISGQVEKRLAEGFEKTTATFADVVKRLALIDQAQKKITELSQNVVSLQEVLADKRSRGAYGEVQLAALVRNVMPESHFALQQTLSNGTRVDCLLYLPSPTGNVAVDAKFPLENYQKMMDVSLSDPERKLAERSFKQDVRGHIRAIADKYIIEHETAPGAVMFVPAEAVFAEIHAHHSDLVEEANRANVWMTSPTTLMAVLNTARSVLKDEATRRQVHIIQEHLVRLNEDFGRFQQRMEKLEIHIGQAHKDVQMVSTSARKITSRFHKIEKVELQDVPDPGQTALASESEDDSEGEEDQSPLSQAGE